MSLTHLNPILKNWHIQVYLPTGTVVTIKPHDGPAYLNIWISAGSADYGKVQGEYGITRDHGVA